jgi:hypothetical protein
MPNGENSSFRTINPSGKDDWDAYRIYILETLARYNKDLDEVKKLQTTIVQDLSEMKAQIAGLKVQSGVWGLIAGSLPVLIAMVSKWILGI